MAKYIFVTGGVVSSLGKGITAASLGRLLKNRGYKVTIQKFDPYINIDPGTMSPYQHGEVFVTDDGTETDLDLGHYERFIDINLFQGYQTLTGKEAAGYMRYIDADGYLSRTQRQERFIKNFYEDRQDCFGVTNAFFMYRAWHNVDSNISAKDMAQLAFDFRGVTADNIDFYILPGEMAMSGKNGDTKYYWTYDPVEVQKVIGRTNNAISTAPEPDDTKQ